MAADNASSRVTPALADVCAAPRQHLASLDLAALNLMCAGGLPEAENVDISNALDWLDQAARRVDLEVRRHWYRFLESPQTYNHSPGYFCCYFLLQVLQEDFGVKYNPVRVTDPDFQDPKCHNPDFRDSRDLFIHGVIDGPGGTCVSMPVLYVSVGRRLGYPLKLVETRGHLFFRWDDPRGERLGVGECFNVEGAGQGIGSYPDEHYRTWPEPWSDADVQGGWYLQSLSPEAELASFLSTRGECLLDNDRLQEAIQAYTWASGLLPNDLRYQSRLKWLVTRRNHQMAEIAELMFFNNTARQQQRQSMSMHGNLAPPVSPHGDSCQCFHCSRARNAAAPQGAPGHMAMCNCFQCKQVRSSNSNRRPPHQPW